MKLRAVVFDDEPLMRRLLEAVLSQREYEVITFPDPGFCPLHVADRCPCPAGTLCADVIISDLRMPNVNGLDFVEALMGKGCRKPQYALISGQWTEPDVERARQLGCKVFMKPFHIGTIIQWLEEIETVIAPDRQLINWNESKWFTKASGSSGQK